MENDRKGESRAPKNAVRGWVGDKAERKIIRSQDRKG